MSSQGPEGVEAGDKVPDAPEESALGARLGGGEGEEEEGGEEGGEPHGAGAVPSDHWGAGGRSTYIMYYPAPAPPPPGL